MNFGILGLGKMGNAIAQRALKAGHNVWGFDLSPAERNAAQAAGCSLVSNAHELLQHARIIWLMVPAGPLIDQIIEQLTPHLQPGDILIDGGNSKFTDSIVRARKLQELSVFFLDIGTSGGIHGLEHGFSLMVGGDARAYQQVISLLTAIAAPQGVALVGPSGAGHYVKMVHNGIEYGLMQAYAEGLHLIQKGSFQDAYLDLATITNVWRHGSVIRSFLLDLTHTIVQKDPYLDTISGSVNETGMGSWARQDAHTHNVPVPVLDASLEVRAASRSTGGNYATKLLAMMRQAFGGHSITKA